jgi:hypothetical protein
MHLWESLLDKAAATPDGGACSFPLSRDVPIYELPNKTYRNAFRSCFNTLQRSSPPEPCCAGWIVPNDCNPIFVAHSLLSAVWLIRQTLPANTLSNDTWACLAHAAEKLSSPNGSSPPPSNQESPLARERTTSPVGSPVPKGPTEVERTTPAVTDQRDRALYTARSNNTMRAERERLRKQDLKRGRQREDLGLIPPNEDAAWAEKMAYAKLERVDEFAISWIFKQPYGKDGESGDENEAPTFFSAVKSPYSVAYDLHQKAMVLGNHDSLKHTIQVLSEWRGRASLFDLRGFVDTASQGETSSQIVHRSDMSKTDRAFYTAWLHCDKSESVMATAYIRYRWAAALLGQAFENKKREIQQASQAISNNMSRNRYGKGKVSGEAIDDLLCLLHQKPTEADRARFAKRLTKAKRWHTIAQRLGWGSFLLMPHDLISNHWVERTLRTGDLDVWLNLIKQVNPDVYNASQKLESWLGPEGIAGESICSKAPLSIEAVPQVYEISDSDDSGDDDNTTEDPSLSPVTAKTATPPRQLKLMDLFNPVAAPEGLSSSNLATICALPTHTQRSLEAVQRGVDLPEARPPKRRRLKKRYLTASELWEL